MTDPGEESTLAPAAVEVVMSAVAVVHVVLVLLALVLVLRGKLTVPHGLAGYVVLILVPVVGPLLVLTWRSRSDRRLAQLSRSAT